ncbi:MAG: hypothetical protein HY925_04865 [Elusimicrobia bacterium]|nr:hypothetical protein [Elusimicrobiota bacterium]
MRDKIELLMQETGCEQGEAELALELCGYEVEKAVAAIPRLFQNIAVLKAKFHDPGETLYGLLLVILNLKDQTLLRARFVVSYNPKVYATSLEQGWFDFEKFLYACRLWDGSLQSVSQELEQLAPTFFTSQDAAPFYSESPETPQDKGIDALRAFLGRRFDRGQLKLVAQRDVLDMGQFQQLGSETGRQRRSRTRRAPSGGSLILRIALEPQADGLAAGELRAGDLVTVTITDNRDIAQYLARLFGPGDGASSLLVPVEAVETGPKGEVGVRVRFSLGVCGDVNLPPDIRLKVVRRSAPRPWWKKLFHGT